MADLYLLSICGVIESVSSIIALAKLFKIDAVDLRTLLLHFVIKLYPQGRY